jgi:hypothetical protein
MFIKKVRVFMIYDGPRAPAMYLEFLSARLQCVLRILHAYNGLPW